MTAASGTCWVCAGTLRPYWNDPALVVQACARCGHLQARHAVAAPSTPTDYHQSYDQEYFLASLAATRQRQANEILDAIARVSPCRSLFDFGCGRGWFLQAARARGWDPVGGGDVSPLAVTLLREQQIPAVTLDARGLEAGVDFVQLGFQPDVITFLDVLEHFDGDLSTLFGGWLARLPEGVRLIVIKVPVREGIMFRAASAARRLALPGLARQLFQVGIPPAHQQYFSRDSLARFVRAVGLRPLEVFDDLDFEVESLAARASLLRRLPEWTVTAGARLLANGARRLGHLDTRIVIAART
jgi:hypothetical protein